MYLCRIVCNIFVLICSLQPLALVLATNCTDYSHCIHVFHYNVANCIYLIFSATGRPNYRRSPLDLSSELMLMHDWFACGVSSCTCFTDWQVKSIKMESHMFLAEVEIVPKDLKKPYLCMNNRAVFQNIFTVNNIVVWLKWRDNFFFVLAGEKTF